MRKLAFVIALLLCCAGISGAQLSVPSNLSRVFPEFSATGTTQDVPLQGTSIRYHRIYWYPHGTVTGCLIKLEQKSVTDTYSDLISNQDCTTVGGTTTSTSGIINAIRGNLTLFTGTGTVVVVWDGWILNPDSSGGGGGGTVQIDQSTPGTTNGVVVNSGTVTVSGTVTATQSGATSTTTTMQNAATGSGNGTDLTVDGMAVAFLVVNCSGCSGGTTINFTSGDGTNMSPIFGTNSAVGSTGSFGTSTTTAGLTYWMFLPNGAKKLRAAVANYSAGTITVTGTTSPVGGGPPPAPIVYHSSQPTCVDASPCDIFTDSHGQLISEIRDAAGNIQPAGDAAARPVYTQNVSSGSSVITFAGSAGTVAITLEGVTNGAGQSSAVYDRGAGTLPQWFKWEAKFDTSTNATLSAPVRIYAYATELSSTSSDFATNAGRSAETMFGNYKALGQVVASQANTGPWYGSGTVYLPGRYLQVGIWNALGQTITGWSTIYIKLTPFY